jgi:hypothetical protein
MSARVCVRMNEDVREGVGETSAGAAVRVRAGERDAGDETDADDEGARRGRGWDGEGREENLRTPSSCCASAR